MVIEGDIQQVFDRGVKGATTSQQCCSLISKEFGRLDLLDLGYSRE